MPKKLCNPALDHDLCRRKFQAQLDADRKFIQAVIAHDDDMVPQLKKMMETLNCWPEIDDIEQDEMPNGSICKAESGQKGGIKRADVKMLTIEVIDGHFNAKRPVPSRYWTIQDLSMSLLICLLSKIPGAVLSPINLVAMFQWWPELDKARLVLCELLEFLSGQILWCLQACG